MEEDKERGIVIVGAGQVGKAAEAAVTALKAEADTIRPMLVVNNLEVKNALREMNGEVSVGDITYTQVEQDKPMSSMVASVLSVAKSLGYKGYGSKVRPNVDIVSEYKLIQKKESKLSRSNRDWVEYRFHRMFKIKKP